MKKLLFSLIATIMCGFVGNSRILDHKDPILRQRCVTISCCGIGPFGVEIFTERYCITFGRTSTNLAFQNTLKAKEIIIANNQILAGEKDEKGENIIIPAGKYTIVNNSIDFVPVTIASRPWCITRTLTWMGHEHAPVTTCYDWIWNKTNPNGTGLITMTPTLNDKDKQTLLSNGTLELKLDTDFYYKDDKVDYVLKAGKYVVNADGNIYIPNAKFIK